MTEAEQLLIDDVLAAARDIQWAGRIEIQLRPGWTPQVFRVQRQLRRESRPLQNTDERMRQQGVVNATG